MRLFLSLLLLLAFIGTYEAQTARNFRTANFSQLGTPTENNARWCPDCAATAPCTGGGSGAYAYANGSAWNCTEYASGGGSGSVTSVSANNSISGVTMTISNPTTTPIINLSGTPNIAASNITSGQIATARILASITNSRCLRTDNSGIIVVASADCGTGTLTGLTVPVEFSASGSPTVTITKATQSANTVWAGPATGSAAQPGFRSLMAADIPLITETKFLFSDIPTANSSTVMHGLLPKLSGSGSDCLRGDGSWLGCGGGSGGGDFSTNTTTSALNQVVVASGSGGKTGQFFTGTGLGSLSSGVLSAVTTSAGISSALSDETGSGFLVFSSSPTLTTPTIGSFANSTHNHTNAAGGGLLGITSFSSSTGSGAVVGQTSPVLVTPSLGVASATSINKVAITAPATSATLTIANGKTLTANNSLALSGTDSTTMTFPSTSGTVLTADSTATLTNKTHTLPILGGNSGLPVTCTVGQRVRDTSVTPNAYYNCISADTWGQELVSGTVGAVAVANGGTGNIAPAGTVTISGATSGSATFSSAYASAPKCQLTPRSDLGSTRFWVTTTITAVTVNTSASVTATFNYFCMP